MIPITVAGPHDAALFDYVHDDVFDGPIRADWLAEYLEDPRQHIVVALDGAQLIGMCSGAHHHHPDKPRHMWINELGVAEPWRRRGIATRLVRALCDHARLLDCTEIWVVADPTMEAEGFYTRLGWDRTGTHLVMFSAAL